MDRKHDTKGKNINKAAVIAVISAIVVVIAVIILFVYFGNFGGKRDNEDVTTNPTTVMVEQTTVADTAADTTTTPVSNNTYAEETTQQSTQVPQEETTHEPVVVPTNEGEEQFYFNANYLPYKAVDTETSEEVSLKVVFGSSYSGGSVEFFENGSFTDGLTNTSATTGSYAVNSESRTISATYINDKNMDITVNSWNGDIPEEIVINYGGYDVYMN